MFKEYFGKSEENFKIETETVTEAVDINKALDKIRKSNIKVKNILPTKFGVEVEFFSTDNAKEAAKLVGTKKVDGKSIFLEN